VFLLDSQPLSHNMNPIIKFIIQQIKKTGVFTPSD